MDPNATLAEIRAILASDDLELPDYERLADLTAALDEWISRGRLPACGVGDPRECRGAEHRDPSRRRVP